MSNNEKDHSWSELVRMMQRQIDYLQADIAKYRWAAEAEDDARQTWPAALLVAAPKKHNCDWRTEGKRCRNVIQPGEGCIAPGEANPDRYCLEHFRYTAPAAV